jgi:hypothetical protein
MMKSIDIKMNGELRTIEIPTCWDEITIEHYMMLNKINKKKYNIELERDMEIIGSFLGLEYDDIELLDVELFNDIIEDLRFLLKEPDLNDELKDYIELSGEKWWIKKDFNKLTMGEKISIETIIQNGGDDFESELPRLLTLFLKKKDKDGEMESYKSTHMLRAEGFKKIKFLDIRNILIFFSGGRNGSENHMKESLENQGKEKIGMKKKKAENLEKK